LIYTILLTVGIYAFTYQHPLDQDKSKKQLVEWINKYTNVDAIFLCEENVDISFLVRIYGNRAVFADIAFPFNESFAKEFTERFLIYNQTINYNPSDYYSLTKKYPIDYLIIHENKKHKFEEYLPVFISKPYLVYKIDQFMTDSSSKGHRKQTL